MQGTLEVWFQDRGFGFIIGENGKKYFLHFSALKEQFKYGRTDLSQGEKVRFEIEPVAAKQCDKAVDVVRLEGVASNE